MRQYDHELLFLNYRSSSSVLVCDVVIMASPSFDPSLQQARLLDRKPLCFEGPEMLLIFYVIFIKLFLIDILVFLPSDNEPLTLNVPDAYKVEVFLPFNLFFLYLFSKVKLFNLDSS